MQNLQAILETLQRPAIGQGSNSANTFDAEEYEQHKCGWMNEEVGTLSGYDCPDCMNRGGSYLRRDGYTVFCVCHCAEIRKSLRNIAKSGLSDLMEICTFDNFDDTEPWQKPIKQSAKAYLTDHTGKWFYIGGQNGAGKTHICTALVGELLKIGKSARYMLWKDESVRLKASVNDDDTYYSLIEPLKTVDVLYIDDFFKMQRGENGAPKPPTPADVNIAFEILNYRYNNPKAITVISTEYDIDELMDIDEAVGSRIYQRTKDYCKFIGRDKAKNYRTRV